MKYFNFGICIAAMRTYIRNKKGRKFEPEIKFLKNIIKEGDNCLHIGASDARHSYVMAELIRNGQVYAFEPSSYSYGHLALKVGSACLVTPEKSTGHAGRSFAFISLLDSTNRKRTDIQSDSATTEEVDAVSIDEFVLENNVPAVDFIRCDTEGSEMLILKGAAKALKGKPNLLIEIHSNALKEVFNSSAKEVSGLLFDLGYHMFREDDGKISKVAEVDESENWKDYFFIHPDRAEVLPEGPFRELLN